MINIRSGQKQPKSAAEFLAALSHKDFLNFGVHDVAYVRSTEVEEKTMYAVHGADGSVLAVMDNEEQALASIRSNNMGAVSIQ